MEFESEIGKPNLSHTVGTLTVIIITYCGYINCNSIMQSSDSYVGAIKLQQRIPQRTISISILILIYFKLKLKFKFKLKLKLKLKIEIEIKIEIQIKIKIEITIGITLKLKLN